MNTTPLRAGAVELAGSGPRGIPIVQRPQIDTARLDVELMTIQGMLDRGATALAVSGQRPDIQGRLLTALTEVRRCRYLLQQAVCSRCGKYTAANHTDRCSCPPQSEVA